MLADADPAPPPAKPGRHLLLVPDTAAGVLAISRTDPRMIARYRSYSLVEAAGDDEARLRDAGAVRRDDMREVATAAGSFDPSADRASLAAKRAPDRDRVLALVQFVGPPEPAWVDRLRATGARVLGYQAQNAYLAYAAGPAVDRVAGLLGTDPAVRAVIPLGPADKVEGRAEGKARYVVSSVPGVAVPTGPGRSATIAGLRTQSVELMPEQVDDLAGEPAVVSVERDAPPTPDDERAGAVLAGQSDYLGWHDARFPGMTAFDTTIDVTDSGLDDPADPSADFHVDGSSANPGRIAYDVDYTGDGDTVDCTGHGTNVASIAAGYNSSAGSQNQESGFNYGLGIAPLATLGVSKIFRCDGSGIPLSTGQVTSMSAAAAGSGADISNNSWGLGGVGFSGAYSARARAYDSIVRDALPAIPGQQPLVEVFSAGNDGADGDGTVNAEASAKNVISVGASEGTRLGSTSDGCGLTTTSDNAGQVAAFSARGPTNDGRLKPDLVAPGTRVTGARPPAATYAPSTNELCSPTFNLAYSMASGTSQAAPQVSGAAALVRHWYLDTVSGGTPPSPAMTKALLINSATDLAAGPDQNQGWGRVNLGSAFDSTAREVYDQQPADLMTSPGQTVVKAFTVQDTSKPLKVTLAWTDPPPAGTLGDAFVNDLDLEVAAGGRTYRGNVFGGAWSRTGGSADARNNVESVYLPAGTTGRVAVTVRGTAINGDAVPGNASNPDQDFALVVSNAAEQAAPVFAAAVPVVSGGDGDDALESGEQAQLTAAVRNPGIGDATGVSGALAGTGSLSVAQGSSAYADVPEDGAAAVPNSTPFTIGLANAATCGADVGATLTMTSNAGTQALPLVIETGAPGAVQTNSSTQVPLTIPDNSATGVSSSLFVAQRGRVKDLNVTIPSPGIVHTSVGDLVVDLIGPDGTTVRLLDHPGGPDNGGDNVAGTTFDDDAAQNVSEGTAPYAGTFRPQNDQLSRFNGKSRRGTWTLRVRDLGSGDVGKLQAWGVTSQKALCNVDTAAPDTSITGGPDNPTTSTAAQFALHSNDAGATFECRLDGAAYAPCGASVAFSGLATGSHAFSARAIDGSDNEDATPASWSWVISAPPEPPRPATPAASFLLAPREARVADTVAGRYSVLAACASACRASAKVSVGASTARRLGLGRKAVSLGSGAKRRSASGTTRVGLRLSRKARAAMRGRKSVKATVTVTLTEGGARMTVKRTLTLLREAGPRRIASKGLSLWAACARRCPLRAQLTVSATAARRLGLKPGTASRYELGSGRITATPAPKTLNVRVHRGPRKALARARKVSALLEAVAGTTPSRSARLSTTLRR